MDKEKPEMKTGRAKAKCPRPGSLKTLDKVRAEMARLYRDARTGKIPTQDATRLGYLLQLISKVIEAIGEGGGKGATAILLDIWKAEIDEAEALQQADEHAQIEEARAV